MLKYTNCKALPETCQKKKLVKKKANFSLVYCLFCVLIITVEMAHGFHNISRARRAKERNPTWKRKVQQIKFLRHWFEFGAEKETETLVWLAPPAVRGSGILWSSLSTPFSSFSSSLGIRKSTLSVGRLEVHIFSSSLDSRSVGCSSTVRKELGLVKWKLFGFWPHTAISYRCTLPRLEQFLECWAILIGNEAGTNSKTKMRRIAVKLCREGGHLIHSLSGVFAGREYLLGNNIRILNLRSHK